jgi:hypothetical protein
MNGLVGNSLLGQQLSKWKLAAGVLTIAMGGFWHGQDHRSWWPRACYVSTYRLQGS